MGTLLRDGATLRITDTGEGLAVVFQRPRCMRDSAGFSARDSSRGWGASIPGMGSR